MKQSIKSVIVLVVICVITSFLLAEANKVTEPRIAALEAARLQATLQEMIPGGQFTLLELESDDLLAAYQETGGAGYVFVTSGKGYHGNVKVITAIDNEGRVIAISVDASGETAGVGSKVALPEYTEKFQGLHGNCDLIDVVGGASYSSNGVKEAVNHALQAYETIAKGS